MRHSINIGAKSCCHNEKDRLMSVLFACDYDSESLEERHACYRKAAKESGKKARECLMASK